MIYEKTIFHILSTALNAFEAGSRRSGRTSRMIDHLKPGHRVVCLTEKEAYNLSHDIRKRDPSLLDSITIVSVSVASFSDNRSIQSARCPTVFTHIWLQEYYECELRWIDKKLQNVTDHIQGKELGLAIWPAPSNYSSEVEPRSQIYEN